MIRTTYLCLLLLSVFLGACSSTSSPRIVAIAVREGMTREQLLSVFGHPLSIQRQPDGAEEWFYNFGFQQHGSRPVSESTVTETGRSYSVAQETSVTTTLSQAPIHLSTSGRVIGPIPAGHVVVD
jgi:outer membrane protein assembly factor BamE (lipoprotein component of BamABCDE complex)